MRKDITILSFIEKLKLVINFTLVDVVDYWEADLCAIGLRRDNRLVYISTFNYVDDNKGNYDFDLEITEGNRLGKLDIVKTGRNVSEAELIDEIKLFLGV